MLHIVPEAVEVPGRCAISQSTTGPFLDTQVTIPRHGRLYLSVPYLNSIAAGLGWVPAPELADALTDLDVSLALQSVLQNRVERFEEDIANVSEAIVAFADVVRAEQDIKGALGRALDEVRTLTARVAELEASA